MTLIPRNCNYIPEIILTNAPSSVLREEEKRILLRYGFVKYMEIKEEDDISILPEEVHKTLRMVVKEYPYTLQTFILSPLKNDKENFSVIRILEDTALYTMWSTTEDLCQVDCFTNYEALRQRAHIAGAICMELTDDSQKWYTLYISSTTIIQTMKIIGNGTVERMKADQALIRMEIPSSITEVTAFGLTNPRIREDSYRIIPELSNGAGPNLDPAADNHIFCVSTSQNKQEK